MQELLKLLNRHEKPQGIDGGEPQPGDNETAKSMAQWSLLEFMSLSIKQPMRSIVPRRFFKNTSVEEMMESKPTILRIEGSITHRPQEYFWFVGVPLHSQVHFFSINTGKIQMATIEPSLDEYRLHLTRTFTKGEIRRKFPIDRTLDLVLNRSIDEVYTGTERIDIMYGGKPVEEPGLSRVRVVSGLQGAII